jgi:hypothetical protein
MSKSAHEVLPIIRPILADLIELGEALLDGPSTRRYDTYGYSWQQGPALRRLAVSLSPQRIWPLYQQQEGYGQQDGLSPEWLGPHSHTAYGVAVSQLQREQQVREEEEIRARAFTPPLFDVFGGGDAWLATAGLLAHRHPVAQTIYRIYERALDLAEWCETLPGIHNLAAEIDGHCYHLFRLDPAFLLAYQVHTTSRILYNGIYYYFDPLEEQDYVVKWLLASHAHHYLTRPLSESDDTGTQQQVTKTHKALLSAWEAAGQDSKLIPKQRVFAAVILMGRSFQDAPQHKQLLDICEANGWTAAELLELRGYLRFNTRAYEEYQKRSLRAYQRERNHLPTSIYRQ